MKSVPVPLPAGVDGWVVYRLAVERMSTALSHLPGELRLGEVSVRDKDGSRVTRGSIEDAHVAVVKYDIQVSMVSQTLTVAPKGSMAILDDVDADVIIWLLVDSEKIDIDVKAQSPLVRDGLAAAASAFARRIAETPPSLPFEAVSAANGDAPAVPTGPAKVLSQPEVERAAAQQSWWRRSWRDHTVVFLVTVIGGVAVLGFGAWLGIG